MELRPRHYAVEILRIENLDERRTYMTSVVPAELLGMVKKYVAMWWAGRHQALQKIDARAAEQAARQRKKTPARRKRR